MKKLMCVLILVAFLGSMVVMTGCFGGDNGGLFAGLFIAIVLTASTGGGAGVAFAANNRTALRPNISISDNAAPVYVKITAMNSAGELVGEGQKYETGLTAGADGKLNVPQFNLDVTSYSQYLMEVYSGEKLILKRIGYIGGSEKTGTYNVEINPESTAKALIYDKWNTTASSRTYAQFEYNLGNTDISAITTNVATNVQTYATNKTDPNLSAIDVSSINVDTTAAYNVSGYVYAADGSGQTDCMIYVYSNEALTQMVDHFATESGRYSVNLQNGTYYFKPTKADHTYTPTSTKVEVSGADVSGINFQAAAATYAAHEEI